MPKLALFLTGGAMGLFCAAGILNYLGMLWVFGDGADMAASAKSAVGLPASASNEEARALLTDGMTRVAAAGCVASVIGGIASLKKPVQSLFAVLGLLGGGTALGFAATFYPCTFLALQNG